LGTVIGIKIAIGGVEGQDFALRDFGIDTALNTTIAGIVGSLWLGFNEKIS
jgi:biopolymer transport protein ExbB/TolQ